MKVYLKNTVKRLRRFSKSLDKQSIFIEKPWALLDDEFELQKLIFKKNKELIMSKNGFAKVGKWEYLSDANSLLLDRGEDRILCNEGFINESVMILKLDGTTDRFFVLANENKIPDLDVYAYLQKLRRFVWAITTEELDNGKTLEVVKIKQGLSINPGMHVWIDASNIENGEYRVRNSNKSYLIDNSKIREIIFRENYTTQDGTVLTILQKKEFSYSKGDQVLINETSAPDGIYRMVDNKDINVRNGIIVKKSFFKSMRM